MKTNIKTNNDNVLPGLNNRILILVSKFTEGNRAVFAEHIGVPQQNFNRLFNVDKRTGKYPKPSDEILSAILNKFPEVNKIWLLTGEELTSNVSNNESKIVNEIIPVPEDDYMVVEFEDLETAAGKLGGNDITILPERKKRLVPKEYAKGSYLVVRVHGESMNDQTYRSILSGDEILIKQYFDFMIENLPIRSKLFVIVTNEGSVVKQITKVDKENNKIICHSFNPNWEDYEIHIDEIIQIFTVEKKVKSNIFF